MSWSRTRRWPLRIEAGGSSPASETDTSVHPERGARDPHARELHSDSEREIDQAFADHAGIAIENARFSPNSSAWPPPMPDRRLQPAAPLDLGQLELQRARRQTFPLSAIMLDVNRPDQSHP